MAAQAEGISLHEQPFPLTLFANGEARNSLMWSRAVSTDWGPGLESQPGEPVSLPAGGRVDGLLWSALTYQMVSPHCPVNLGV